MTGMRFEILGPLRAWRDDGELELGPAKQRAVLAVLLMNAGRPVPTGQIVDAVWPEELPANGPNVVQKYVAGLRRVLEPDRSPRAPGQLLSLTDAGYLLRIGSEAVDLALFEQWIQRARGAWARGQLTEVVADLQAALALWRGEPLAGLPGPFFNAARVRLIEARAGALELRAEVELLLGHHQELIGELVRLVAEFPVRERLRYLFMLALYRSGRQADALAVFREIRAVLADEYGLEPGEELQELHRQILRSDPRLAPAVEAATIIRAPVEAKRRDVDGSAPPVQAASALAPAPGPAPASVPAFAEHPAPGSAPVPGPAPARTVGRWDATAVSAPWAPERPAWVANLGTGLGALVILVSFGLLTWAVMLCYAIVRRSRWLAAATVGYLGLAVLFLYAMESPPDPEIVTEFTGVGILALLVAWIAGLIHVVAVNRYVRALIHGRPVDQGISVERVQREQARYLLHHYPAARGGLHIGRPDLPRGYDDGGLIDVNAVPDHIIHQLPGLKPDQRQRIAALRLQRGGFTSMEDLAAHCQLPSALSDQLREILVFLPPPHSAVPSVGPPSWPSAER